MYCAHILSGFQEEKRREEEFYQSRGLPVPSESGVYCCDVQYSLAFIVLDLISHHFPLSVSGPVGSAPAAGKTPKASQAGQAKRPKQAVSVTRFPLLLGV